MPHSIRSFSRLLAIAGINTCLLAPSVSSQLFHLPPVRRSVFPKGESVMTLSDLAVPPLKLTLAIDNDRMIVTKADGTTDVIPLSNRDMSDVAADLEKRYSGLKVRTPYPLENARLLAPTRPQQIANTLLSILANSDDPQIELNFGTVFSLATPNNNDTPSGLLTATGFQLDLVGSYQPIGPRIEHSGVQPPGPQGIQIERDRAMRSIAVFLLPRLSLSANQQLQVSADSAGSHSNSTQGQFEDALQQADQVGLSLQADIVFPLAPERFDFTLSPVYAVSWTRLADPGFRDIVVANKVVPLGEQFEPTLAAQAKRALRQALPLSEGGVMGTLTFQHDHRPLFYLGGGVMRREILKPNITYTRSGADDRPDSLSLKANLIDPPRSVWRATFGARIAGILDVRLDAAGPIGARDIEPLLKVLIGSTFPVLRDSK